MLSAEASERGKRLATKAQQGRPTAAIDKLLPAGTVDLDQMPERGDFAGIPIRCANGIPTSLQL